MIKLVAIDMDGTLLTDNKIISANTKETLLKARKNGVNIVLTTGRPLDGLKNTLEFLEFERNPKDYYGHIIQDHVICFNGALVTNLNTKQNIADITIKGAHLHELHKLSKQLNTNIHAFSVKDGLIAQKISKYTQVEMDINHIPIKLLRFGDISNEEDIVKVMLIDEPEILDTAIAKLPAKLYDTYTIVRSTPYFLEFLNKEANKGTGLAKLAKHLNIVPGEIMAFGDAGNDMHMIEYAGLGVAMDNAISQLKQIAQFVAPSNNKDGVATTLQQFSIDKIRFQKPLF